MAGFHEATLPPPQVFVLLERNQNIVEVQYPQPEMMFMVGFKIGRICGDVYVVLLLLW